MKMHRAVHALKTVQKLSVKQWTRHIVNKRHISDVAELALVC